MRIWILITAWTLIPFGAIGLLISLPSFSIRGIIINLALIGIGVLDLKSLKRAPQTPSAWNSIALTQFTLGIIIGGSLLFLGLSILDSDAWQQGTTAAIDILGNPPGIEDALEQSAFIMKWGLIIGGVLVFLSQVMVSWRLHRLAKMPPML